MRTVVHLSGLHFGKVAHRLLTPRVEAVIAATPDVVVVSGDDDNINSVKTDLHP